MYKSNEKNDYEIIVVFYRRCNMKRVCDIPIFYRCNPNEIMLKILIELNLSEFA